MGFRLILANESSILGVCVYAGCNSQYEVESAAVTGSLDVSTRAAQAFWAADSLVLSVGWWSPCCSLDPCSRASGDEWYPTSLDIKDENI